MLTTYDIAVYMYAKLKARMYNSSVIATIIILYYLELSMHGEGTTNLEFCVEIDIHS